MSDRQAIRYAIGRLKDAECTCMDDATWGHIRAALNALGNVAGITHADIYASREEVIDYGETDEQSLADH